MRLRRTTALAGVPTAAGAGTPSPPWPRAQVGRSQPLPALTAQALATRYATDSHMISRAALAASHTGDQGLARSLDTLRGGHFIGFNPAGQGLAVEVFGNLAQARRV